METIIYLGIRGVHGKHGRLKNNAKLPVMEN